MQSLTETQRRKLEKNPNVKRVTAKSVEYTGKFKVEAVEQYLEGRSPEAIFSAAKLPAEYFPQDYFRYCLKRWKKKYEEQGAESLFEDGRGRMATGRPKSETLEDLSYDELMSLVEIQREVIAELKKRRALAKKKL